MGLLVKDITATSNQRFQFELEDGTFFDIVLQYRDQQRGWFFDLIYQDFVLNGIRLALSLNLLEQYKNLIPFGMAIATNDGIEPIDINDFESDRIRMIILNSDEVVAANDFLNSQKDGAGEV